MQTQSISQLFIALFLTSLIALTSPPGAVAAAPENEASPKPAAPTVTQGAENPAPAAADEHAPSLSSDPAADPAPAAAAASAAETQVEAAGNDSSQGVMRLFDAGTIAPFKPFIGDSGYWSMPAAAGSVTSVGGAISVALTDHVAENDALRITWHGGTAQYYLQADGNMNLQHLLESDAAMVMLVRIDQPPAGSFAIRMDCGFPCGASADLARPFRAIPPGNWFRLAIDLQCFAKEGADFSRIDTPFLLLADKKFTLSVSSVAFVSGAAKDATVKCR